MFNCLLGYGLVASKMGSSGAAAEWNPGYIKLCGMNIDPGKHRIALGQPRKLRLYLIDAAKTARLGLLAQPPERSREPRTASRALVSRCCPKAAQSASTRLRWLRSTPRRPR